MEEVTAFKCSQTGRLYDDPREAIRSEFHALMRKLGNQLPLIAGVDAPKIMECLAGALEGDTYNPSAINAFLAAADHVRLNRAALTTR